MFTPFEKHCRCATSSSSNHCVHKHTTRNSVTTATQLLNDFDVSKLPPKGDDKDDDKEEEAGHELATHLYALQARGMFFFLV